MKEKKLIEKIKTVVAFILGIIISGSGVYAATILFNSNQVGYDNTSSGMSATNVQDALDELYTKVPKKCTTSPFHLGDYISMTPTATTFTPDADLTGCTEAGSSVVGAINPSELNLWRVLRVNGDCTVELVSEYVSSVNVKFAGKTGYKNYIYYLNEIAKQYANTTYTLNPSTAPDGAFRNVGYDGQTKQITNTTRIDDTTLGASGGAWYQKTTSMNGEESLGGGDQGYLTDLKLMEDAGISLVAYKANTTTFTSYWLASRLYYWSSTSNWGFNARHVNNYGYIDCNGLYYWNGSSLSALKGGVYDAVRPVITLKSNVGHSSGDGTASSPIQLSAS